MEIFLPVYNSPSTVGPLSICALQYLVHYYPCALFFNISLLHTFHVAPFLALCRPFLCCTHFVLDFIRVALFHISLFLCCTFPRVASYCTHFMLHFFCVALISCCIFSVLHFFLIALFFKFQFFLCGTPFMLHFSVLHFFNFALILSSTFFMLHSFCVALFSWHTFFCFTLFSCCTFMHSFHVALFSFCTLFLLNFFMLHFFHVELFSCYTFLMLYRFHVAPSCLLHSFHVAPFIVLPLVAPCSSCAFQAFSQNFIKKTLHHRRLSENFVKFLRTPFLKNIRE